MAGCGGCEWAVTPANKKPALTFLQTGRSSQLLQDVKSDVNPLFSVFAFEGYAIPVRHLLAYRAHGYSQFPWR